jgi:hypothetical protein
MVVIASVEVFDNRDIKLTTGPKVALDVVSLIAFVSLSCWDCSSLFQCGNELHPLVPIIFDFIKIILNVFKLRIISLQFLKFKVVEQLLKGPLVIQYWVALLLYPLP